MEVSSRSHASAKSSGEPGIKTFMSSMSSKLSEISDDLHVGKQHCTTLKGSIKTLEYKSNESCNSLTSSVLSALSQLEKDFKVFAREESSDSSTIKQQLISLNQEKMKVEQHAMLLDSRVSEAEKEIGIEVSLPILD